jgi:hypothetical protein
MPASKPEPNKCEQNESSYDCDDGFARGLHIALRGYTVSKPQKRPPSIPSYRQCSYRLPITRQAAILKSRPLNALDKSSKCFLPPAAFSEAARNKSKRL